MNRYLWIAFHWPEYTSGCRFRNRINGEIIEIVRCFVVPYLGQLRGWAYDYRKQGTERVFCIADGLSGYEFLGH